MLSYTSLILAALVSLAQSHVVFSNIQGDPGSNVSTQFGLDPAMARNCTLISACQLDTNIIRDAEIDGNLVNLCGRNQLIGNIDIAFHTEAAIAAGAVTQVKKGSQITIQMHQVNADGAGPYECDIDEGSNSSLMVKKLTMINNVPGVNGVSQAMVKDFNITAKMPDDFTCYGASPGNICTIRCRNNAVAGPFGGCFAVQQTDVEPTVNTASSIKTFKDGAGIIKQVQGNLKDLANGKAANAQQGLLDANNDKAHANKELLASMQSNIYPETRQPEQAKGAGAPATTTAAAAAPSSVATSPLLAPSAAPTAAPAVGGGGAAAPSRVAGGGRQGQRPNRGGNGAGRAGGAGAGAGPGAGAGANPFFPFPTRAAGNNGNAGNAGGAGNSFKNKRDSVSGMRWARRFL
ncbi:Mitochondrial fission 1 protein [Apiospora arundinis]